MTPAPSHLLRFHFVCGAKEVYLELFATTTRDRNSRKDRNLDSNGRGKKGLSETSRPVLISPMSPDLTQPTH